jgi:hypothetical protein
MSKFYAIHTKKAKETFFTFPLSEIKDFDSPTKGEYGHGG